MRHHRRHPAGCPAGRQQFFLRLRRRLRRFDGGDDGVDVGQRHRQPFEDVGALTGFAKFKQRAPGDDFTAVLDKFFKGLLEIKQARLVLAQRHHVDAERGLHLGSLIQVVQHHVGLLAALQLDDHAHAGLVRFIAHGGDAFEPFGFHQVGDFLHQPRLVDLIGQLVDDDGFPAVFGLLDFRSGADVDAPAAGLVGLADAAAAVDDAGGGKIRARQVRHQPGDGDARVFD